jgi:hypothetical protein
MHMTAQHAARLCWKRCCHRSCGERWWAFGCWKTGQHALKSGCFKSLPPFSLRLPWSFCVGASGSVPECLQSTQQIRRFVHVCSPGPGRVPAFCRRPDSFPSMMSWLCSNMMASPAFSISGTAKWTEQEHQAFILVGEAPPLNAASSASRELFSRLILQLVARPWRKWGKGEGAKAAPRTGERLLWQFRQRVYTSNAIRQHQHSVCS